MAIGTGQGGYSTSYKCFKVDDSGSEISECDEDENSRSQVADEKGAQESCQSKQLKEKDGLGLQDLLSDIDEPGNDEQAIDSNLENTAMNGEKLKKGEKQHWTVGELEETKRASITQAYMLVYIREDVRKDIL